ncbi:uncharacterized protein LOC132925452 [Rhopalosiphum padi]|uniref:uncharacterized protein LOC132925452 n=1 Tax=Rhopalosiphum padi TaxID=40932 RepID=UPI00298E2C3E|nr:uncharacterized protein LOC132925452 [Rhopalosiphum padi]
MLERTLAYSHGVDSAAAKNYVANVSRTLAYVQRRLVENKTPPEHWSALVTVDVDIYIEYFRLREEIGQTKATTINYLKNLRMLFHNIMNSYVQEDPAFPKDFDLSPCVKTVTAIKLLDHKLGLVYKRSTKQQPGELFTRKTREAETLPEFEAVVESFRKIKGTIHGNLRLLEDRFGNSGTVNVRSEKNSPPAEKELSKLWRQATCALVIELLWTSKQRSGVAVGMTIGEWECRRTMDTRSIITVAEHKTGDKEPATLVLQEGMGELMERYYRLRLRLGYGRPNFFVTNRGEKVVKIYDDVNKTFGARLSATLFRRMVETEGRDHDAATSSGVAKALQHSEDTASRYYRVPDAAEAIRRQGNLDRVEHTALLKSYVDKHFEDFFPLIAHSPFPKTETAIDKINESDIMIDYPSAAIDMDYIIKLQDRYDATLLAERVDVLAELVKLAGFDRANVSDYAIIDVAKKKKVHFFLNNLRYRRTAK